MVSNPLFISSIRIRRTEQHKHVPRIHPTPAIPPYPDEDGNDEQGSLRWFMIQSGPYTLYGQMLNVGVLDGRNRALTFLRNSTTSEIRVQMPHFWTYADLDPNFSVLLDGSSGSSATTCDRELIESSNKHKPYYPIIIGVVVGFFVVLTLALVLVRHRIVLWKKKREHRKRLALSDLPIEKQVNMEVRSSAGHFLLQL